MSTGTGSTQLDGDAGPDTSVRRGRTLTVAALWGLTVALLLTAARTMVLVRADGGTPFGDTIQAHDLVDLALSLALTSIGAAVVLRGDARRYGWLLLLTGTTLGLVEAAGEHAVYGLLVAHDAVGRSATVAAAVQELWMVVFASLVLLVPSSFPDGAPTPKWRRAVTVTTGGWAVTIVLHLLGRRALSNSFQGMVDPPANPLGLVDLPVDLVNMLWFALTLGSLVIAAGSLVTRWRDVDRDVRRQVAWVLYALGLAAGVLLLAMANTFVEEALGIDLGLSWLQTTAVPVAWLGVVLAIGAGVLRYRLYDIDLVVNRTLVYTTMTLLVLATYVGVVVVVGGAREAPGALLATVAVAVGFAPVRDRVQRGVNRLVFGRRDDPLAVLTELGEVLAASAAPATTLHTLVETVVDALKVPGAAVELDLDGGTETRAAAGDLATGTEPVPLRHQGEIVGRLLVARRSPGEALHEDDHRLLASIAHHAAGLAQSVRLMIALQRTREELVLAREEERRRLRRDLHDGLGPTLASQTFRLDAIRQTLPTDPARAQELIDELKVQNREIVADVRRLVYELRPPALDELGLVGALAAHAGQLAEDLDVVVQTEPDPLGPLPAAVEVAAYRIAREAVTNTVRHAEATRCVIELRRAHDAVTIEVVDDGIGVRAVTAPGVGMASMRERAEELGGALDILGEPDRGTRVLATLPLTPPVPDAIAPVPLESPALATAEAIRD